MTDLRRLLFPDENRYFPGRRWLMIGLRTLHLIGVAGVGGGFLYAAPVSDWYPYLALTVSSGLLLLLLEVACNGIWLFQLRGLAVLAKVAIFAAYRFVPGIEFPVMMAVIVISGVIAHAPARVRHYSILRRRPL